MGREPARLRNAERVTSNGNVQPVRSLTVAVLIWARWPMALQSDSDNRICDTASDCFLAETKDIVVGLGAARGQDARAPRMANHSIETVLAIASYLKLAPRRHSGLILAPYI
jgi:hypothetical protein